MDNENETTTVEITVHSFLASLADDEEEWTVNESFEEVEEVLEFFDFDDLEGEQDEEDKYGLIGHGVSDTISVMSDLTMPNFESLRVVVSSSPPPVLSLPSEDATSPLHRRQQAPRNETPSPSQNPATQQSLPFQRIKLKKSFTNPPRLPQMRDAALLLLYRQQLKPVAMTGDDNLHTQHAKAPWNRSLRRCVSDKPLKRDATRDTSESLGNREKIPRSPFGSRCLLDFDWDELDEKADMETKPDRGPETTPHRPEGVTRCAGTRPSQSSAPCGASEMPTTQCSTGDQIRQTDGFYDSVSVSFLASSVREDIVVQVVDEALRILRTGGILNVLDIDGGAMQCIRRQPQFGLAFARATSENQERHETNTLSILRKSGLQTKLDIRDPHLVHWTARKEEAITTDVVRFEPTQTPPTLFEASGGWK